jgi:hypothetical protein
MTEFRPDDNAWTGGLFLPYSKHDSMTSWKQTEMEAMLFEVWDLRDETEKVSSIDLRSIRALAETRESDHLTLIKNSLF